MTNPIQPVAWLREQRCEYEGPATLAPLLLLGPCEVTPHSKSHGATYEPLYGAAEIERLTGALAKANSQAEHFEREWYLRGDEIERLTAKLASEKTRAELAERALADLGVTPKEAREGAIRSKANQKDAERYRWLRDFGSLDYGHGPFCVAGTCMADCYPIDDVSLDLAVDAAMQASAAPSRR